jgi:hypothetical protein
MHTEGLHIPEASLFLGVINKFKKIGVKLIQAFSLPNQIVFVNSHYYIHFIVLD